MLELLLKSRNLIDINVTLLRLMYEEKAPKKNFSADNNDANFSLLTYLMIFINT